MTVLDDLLADLPHVTVTPVQPLIGAEIAGLDIAEVTDREFAPILDENPGPTLCGNQQSKLLSSLLPGIGVRAQRPKRFWSEGEEVPWLGGPW